MPNIARAVGWRTRVIAPGIPQEPTTAPPIASATTNGARTPQLAKCRPFETPRATAAAEIAPAARENANSGA